MCDTICMACDVSFGNQLFLTRPRSLEYKLHYAQNHAEDKQSGCAYCNGEFDSRDLYGQDMGYGYDRSVMQSHNERWTEVVQVLGLNYQLPSIQKAFLSGHGVCDDMGFAEVRRGNHKNSPQDLTVFECYQFWNDNLVDVVFPFHPECYQLLQEVGNNGLQLDILYSVFLHRSSLYQPSYRGADDGEDWTSFSGDEYLVMNPGAKGINRDYFEQSLQQISHRWTERSRISLKKVRNDPFDKLPNEVVNEITRYLPTGSLFSMLKASLLVSDSCGFSGFWQRQITVRLPWFWELREFVEAKQLTAIDAKQLFLWAYFTTTPRPWLEGQLMTIANRRRIWQACEQIVDLYYQQVDRISSCNSSPTASQDILERGQVLQMPYISYFKECDDAKTITSIWLKDHGQIYRDYFLLITYWEQKTLIGICVSSPHEDNLFGRDDGPDSNVEQEEIGFSWNDWPKGFILHTQDPSLFGDDIYSCIEGIDVVFTSGKTVSLGSAAYSGSESCARPLYVGSGSCLVGIKGVLSRDRILQLGLVQASFFPTITAQEVDGKTQSQSCEYPKSALPESHKYLWRSSLENDLDEKLWDLSNLTYQEISEDGIRYLSTVPDTMVPRHPLLFAKSRAELVNLTKIWAIITPADFIGNSLDGTRGLTTWRVAGMCVEKTVYGEPMVAYAGYNANAGPAFDTVWSADSPEISRDKDQVQSLTIDGPGGEIITEVALSRRHDSLRSLKFTTNWTREVIFGETTAPHNTWTTVRAPEHEAIIGISLAFGIVGWDPDVESQLSKNKRLLSRVGIITIKDS